MSPRILCADEAHRAVYFDFEGAKHDAPSLAGWMYSAGKDLYFEQRVIEEELFGAYPRKVPQTGGAIRCSNATLDEALEEIAELLDEDRLLVSWSNHDLDIVNRYGCSEDAVAAIEACHRNALPTARRWATDCLGVRIKRGGWDGEGNTLSRYRQLAGLYEPDKYGQGIAAKAIRSMRKALAGGGASTLSPSVRTSWKQLLGHNYLDCRDMRTVCIRAAAELAEL